MELGEIEKAAPVAGAAFFILKLSVTSRNLIKPEVGKL
jgi:hypothetical protein